MGLGLFSRPKISVLDIVVKTPALIPAQSPPMDFTSVFRSSHFSGAS